MSSIALKAVMSSEAQSWLFEASGQWIEQLVLVILCLFKLKFYVSYPLCV